MKRLLQISLDTLLISALPILMWILLGFVLSRDIANIFSLTYPLQFFYLIFVYVFAIGPNITSKKLNKDNMVYSNMIFGTLFVGVITLILILNINYYIGLMNMSISTYYNFCIYSIIWMYFNFVMQTITQKLYYDEKNIESNKINLVFNLTNFFLIIFFSLVTKNQIISICITLIMGFIILIYEFIKHYKKMKFELFLKDSIKYTSFKILGNVSMLLIYGIGFGNSFSYGKRYIDSINVEGLTTDMQWDVLDSVDTTAKIDFSKNNFNYKESLKNAYKLLSVLIGTILIMNLIFYWYFKPDILFLLIILGVQIIDMLVHPLISIKMNYLQINTDTKKHNIFYIIGRIGRTMCSLIPTVFCVYIGQLFGMIYFYLYSRIQCRNVEIFKLRKSV